MTFRNFGVVLPARRGLSVVGPSSSGVLLLRPLFKLASILPECDIKATSTFSLCVVLISDTSLAVSMRSASLNPPFSLFFSLAKAKRGRAASTAQTPSGSNPERCRRCANLWLNGLLSLEQILAVVWILPSCARQQNRRQASWAGNPASERWKPQRSDQERPLRRPPLKSPLTGGHKSERNELLPLNPSTRREFNIHGCGSGAGSDRSDG